MSNHTPARVVLVGLLWFAGATLGCDNSQFPLAPSRTPATSPIQTPIQALPPLVGHVNPNKAATVVPTPVTISGSQFQQGLTVTFGDSPAIVLEATAWFITAMAPIRVAGPVDIVVANPDGQSGRLSGRFVYEVAPVGLPSIQTVSPNHGVTTGDAPTEILGTGFSFATSVRLGGVPVRSYVNSTGSLTFTAPAHAAGLVDIAVINPDGEARLPGAFTYVAPENLDINGTWEGRAGDHWDFPLSFSIENDVLVSLSCDGTAARAFSVPLSRSNGGYSFVQNGVVILDGGFRSSDYGTGSINVAPCNIQWEACSRESKLPWCWNR